jgi:hypothetical protein
LIDINEPTPHAAPRHTHFSLGKNGNAHCGLQWTNSIRPVKIHLSEAEA